MADVRLYAQGESMSPAFWFWFALCSLIALVVAARLIRNETHPNLSGGIKSVSFIAGILMLVFFILGVVYGTLFGFSG